MPKIALVHDHLNQNGGAEKVLEALHELFSDSPTYTLVYDRKKINININHEKIRTSFIQKFPFGVKKFEWFLIFMPAATENYDLSEFDIVISSASAFSKGIITKPETLHICYCHTPTRYLWTDSINYVKELRHGPIIKRTLPLVLTKLRQWDRLAAERVNLFIANSNEVKKRIKKYYRHDSIIIFPPVDTYKYQISTNLEDYYLAGGRLVPYKRFDLAIHTFNRLGFKLKIFGDGPMLKDLKKMAGPTIEFLGTISDFEKIKLYENCRAFIHPQVEDFGITAVEAMAAGRPVVAYGKGGSLDTIIDGQTGVLFHEQNWETMADTLLRFDHTKFNPEFIKNHAEQFDKSVFQANMEHLVNKTWAKFQSSL
ncbi:glycosyltransferase family 4 protein [Candidatus Falkowbacteria bacterium CG10_big_fil_rev_8_21_14_0_10_39_11]|uniref:Glycosyltransferase family 4 protein n=1 Tax=Candidatus Falkowbacteria bacterium CG10_big_fil_rev_8_21_14_0_10_39_11 TaxID=1974565 RepID=A0A2H0V5J4_9BACT|nr:MAG: glycosyltransferase family 4 protein [Candidatus Falkowbacteria bacterium CG10_big_fil_rev_8_21_14_0_10_39_11]